MAIPSIYINLEDDVARIAARLKRVKSPEVVLVCPRRCFLFSDSINLRLLKKQTELLDKKVSILTMDERGQLYAKEAGFDLKFLPKTKPAHGVSDINSPKFGQGEAPQKTQPEKENLFTHTVQEIKKLVKPAIATSAVLAASGSLAKKSLVRGLDAKKNSVPKVSLQDTFFPGQTSKVYSVGKKTVLNQKIVTALVAISLLLILALVFVILPKATVVLYPKTEPVTRDLEVSASTAIAAANPSSLVLPATQIEENMEVTGKYQSQGKKEVGNKATGLVTIYNFTKLPLNLKANTTVLTVGSKSYLLVNDVAGLRPTGYKNARTREVDPNTLAAPVPIIASDGGDSFNLPAGTRLEITNQVFGSKPQFLYAKSQTAIEGGTSRYLSVVSDQDITGARNDLGSQMLDELRAKLKNRGLLLPEKTYSIDQVAFVTDQPAGSQAPSFEADLKAKVTGLAVNQNQLTQLVLDRINQTLSANKTLVPADSQQPISQKVKSVDLNNQQMVLSVHFEGKAVLGISLNNIASELTGKTQNQVNEILRSKAEVDRIDITLAPSWQKNFPWFGQKITVIIGNTP